jgi:hypothetical protein
LLTGSKVGVPYKVGFDQKGKKKKVKKKTTQNGFSV